MSLTSNIKVGDKITLDYQGSPLIGIVSSVSHTNIEVNFTQSYLARNSYDNSEVALQSRASNWLADCLYNKEENNDQE